MNPLLRTLLLATTIALSSLSAADAAIPWHTSIEEAKAIAAQSNRLVLIHFWSTTCHPCMKLEHEVYNQPGIEQEITAGYVPVKINLDQYPALSQQYNITSIPADVVLTADGNLVAKRPSPIDRAAYVSGLNQLATTVRGQGPPNAAGGPTTPGAAMPGVMGGVQPGNPQAMLPSTAPVVPGVGGRYAGHPAMTSFPPHAAPPAGVPPQQGMAGPAYGPPASSGPPTYTAPTGPGPAVASYPPAQTGPPSMTGVVSNPQNPYANLAAGQQPMPSAGVMPGQPAMPPVGVMPGQQAMPPVGPGMGVAAMPARPPMQPQLALDGSCPVELVEKEQWMAGDKRFGMIHRGQLYLFSGPGQMEKFRQNPDFYSPALGGHDPVLAVDQRRLMIGQRQHGVFYGKRIFLFASEESLNAFSRDPLRYAEGIRQAEATGQLLRR